MVDPRLPIIYIIISISVSYLAFLHWYATIKADWNKILLGVSIFISTVAVDAIFFSVAMFVPHMLDDYHIILIPKLILVGGTLNMIRASFSKV